MSTLDLAALNSATKYPSIPTHHALDPKNGGLLETPTAFTGDVILTEKVDGTNGRIVLLPGGDYFIGSREELLHAKGDRVFNPALGIVEALRPLAEQLSARRTAIAVYFLEVYGHKIGGAAKQYTVNGAVSYRLFDVAFVPTEALTWPRERIASWRDNTGPQWATEAFLLETGIDLTPRLGTVSATELPAGLEEMHEWLLNALPATRVALDEGAGGQAEGIVLRTDGRSVIAKARFQDYERTLKRRAQKR